MDFWSKGLGRRELVMDMGQEHVEYDGSQLLLSGVVKAPVNWAYIMYLPPEDWHEFFRTALRPECATYLLARDHLKTLGKLMLFLIKFIPLYLIMVARVVVGLAPALQIGETVQPDLTGEADIDEEG